MAILRTYVSRLALGILCLLALLCLVRYSVERYEFDKLRWYRRDTAQARVLATHLKECPWGVRMALRDFDCFGGTTRGWANWMLECSSITSVESSLHRVLVDNEESHSRRVAAAWILWHRTHDRSYLAALFQLVKGPGGTSVRMGRQFLSMTANDVEVMRLLSTTPPAAQLSMKESTFLKYLRDGAVGKSPGTDSVHE